MNFDLIVVGSLFLHKGGVRNLVYDCMRKKGYYVRDSENRQRGLRVLLLLKNDNYYFHLGWEMTQWKSVIWSTSPAEE